MYTADKEASQLRTGICQNYEVHMLKGMKDFEDFIKDLKDSFAYIESLNGQTLNGDQGLFVPDGKLHKTTEQAEFAMLNPEIDRTMQHIENEFDKRLKK